MSEIDRVRNESVVEVTHPLLQVDAACFAPVALHSLVHVVAAAGVARDCERFRHYRRL